MAYNLSFMASAWGRRMRYKTVYALECIHTAEKENAPINDYSASLAIYYCAARIVNRKQKKKNRGKIPGLLY